jgi:hypothetical protein
VSDKPEEQEGPNYPSPRLKSAAIVGGLRCGWFVLRLIDSIVPNGTEIAGRLQVFLKLQNASLAPESGITPVTPGKLGYFASIPVLDRKSYPIKATDLSVKSPTLTLVSVDTFVQWITRRTFGVIALPRIRMVTTRVAKPMNDLDFRKKNRC